MEVVTRQPVVKMPYSEAVEYAKSTEFNKMKFTGCFCVKCGTCPIGVTFHWLCGSLLCINYCMCIPVLFTCPCSCCVLDYGFIIQNDCFRGDVLIVDAESNTLAVYAHKVRCAVMSTPEPEYTPCCICYKK